MNTYLLYCRFQQMRGGFERRRVQARDRRRCARCSPALDEPHWREYLAAWPAEEARGCRSRSAPGAAATPAIADGRGRDSLSSELPIAVGDGRRPTVETIETTEVYIEASSIAHVVVAASPGADWSCGSGRPCAPSTIALVQRARRRPAPPGPRAGRGARSCRGSPRRRLAGVVVAPSRRPIACAMRVQAPVLLHRLGARR